MSEFEPQPPAIVAPTPGLSQIQRLTNIFIAPSKTFEDIRDKSRSWWLPFVIVTIFLYIFFAAITVKVGWNQVGENLINADASAQARLASAPPEAREQAVQLAVKLAEYPFLINPILGIIFALIGVVVLWGTVNFIFGGKAKFWHIFSVWMWAGLPGIIKLLLGSAMLFAGTAPDMFNLKNFAPTNPGYILPADINKMLMVVATKLDFTEIWGLVLLSIGVSIVAGVKRSAGYISVFSWWFVLLLLALLGAAFSG